MKDFAMKYRVKYGSGDNVKNRLFLDRDNARKFFSAMSAGMHNPQFVPELYHWEQSFDGRWNWANIGL